MRQLTGEVFVPGIEHRHPRSRFRRPSWASPIGRFWKIGRRRDMIADGERGYLGVAVRGALRIMTVLKGYFDDSGDDNNPARSDNAFVFAGYVGDVESWKTFEILWQAVLDKHQVPYVHMRELAHCLKPYKKWKSDEDGRIAFINDLVGVVGKSKLFGFGTLIRLHDLRRFNAERSLQIDAVALALYACLIDIRQNMARNELS